MRDRSSAHSDDFQGKGLEFLQSTPAKKYLFVTAVKSRFIVY